MTSKQQSVLQNLSSFFFFWILATNIWLVLWGINQYSNLTDGLFSDSIRLECFVVAASLVGLFLGNLKGALARSASSILLFGLFIYSAKLHLFDFDLLSKLREFSATNWRPIGAAAFLLLFGAVSIARLGQTIHSLFVQER